MRPFMDANSNLISSNLIPHRGYYAAKSGTSLVLLCTYFQQHCFIIRACSTFPLKRSLMHGIYHSFSAWQVSKSLKLQGVW